METHTAAKERTSSQLSPLEKLKRKNTEIIGLSVLGEKLPSQMSFEEFWQPEGLLYHGAAQEFEYSPQGEYDPTNTGSDGTTDYGLGFYTTDNLTQAENYSLVRKPKAEPIVYGFRPYQAKMLDVRQRENPNLNGALPKWLVEAWLEYAQNYVKNQNWLPPMSPQLKQGLETFFQEQFIDRVQNALNKGQPIYIRNQRSENGIKQGIFYVVGNGLIDQIFRDFMLSLGIDGMIYREGGEGENRAPLTGYVFYNPEVIDTYAGWINRPDSSSE